MSVLIRAVLTTALAAVILRSAHAQAPTGTIEGRIQSRVTGDALNNARVAIKGTSTVAFTDEGGFYHLPNVPAGPTTLRVVFTGLDEQEATVVVTPGGVAQQDFALTTKARTAEAGEMIKLDAVTVQRRARPTLLRSPSTSSAWRSARRAS